MEDFKAIHNMITYLFQNIILTAMRKKYIEGGEKGHREKIRKSLI